MLSVFQVTLLGAPGRINTMSSYYSAPSPGYVVPPVLDNSGNNNFYNGNNNPSGYPGFYLYQGESPKMLSIGQD